MYDCAPNFKVNDADRETRRIAVCSSTGTWAFSAECIPGLSSGGVFGLVWNGPLDNVGTCPISGIEGRYMVKGGSGMPTGSVVLYECAPNHVTIVLNGVGNSGIATCMDNGEWQFTAECVPEDHNERSCPVYPGETFQFTEGSNTPGATIGFECRNGYQLEGTATAICQSDGTWLFNGRCSRGEATQTQGQTTVAIVNNTPNLYHDKFAIFISLSFFLLFLFV